MRILTANNTVQSHPSLYVMHGLVVLLMEVVSLGMILSRIGLLWKMYPGFINF
jgi:hypothetical protein